MLKERKLSLSRNHIVLLAAHLMLVLPVCYLIVLMVAHSHKVMIATARYSGGDHEEMILRESDDDSVDQKSHQSSKFQSL